ncbi:MAG: putative spermidine/putrescine transport system permease protein [Solirubrobacteraceae bacterium]|nr:Spermidine Putrescine transporter permease component PotB [Solirubrobacterales bacterium]MEA2214539.1 putative spermidine/putrescine transport system permease protein [Solirubrobacteraceae bacterium]
MASSIAASRTPRARVSAALFRRPWLRAVLLLSAPGAWFVLIYLAALALLFVSALWKVDPLSGKLIHSWTLQNFEELVNEPVYRTIALRTIGIAAAATLTDVLLAVPFAFFAVRVASKRMQGVLFVAVLIPLWSSYLVRVFAWRLILAKNGILNSFLGGLGLGSVNIGYSNTAMWIVFSYIWLPFMILPVWSSLERVPDSLIEASADLGARGWRTFRTVIFPLILPGIAAGSIFTFALTLGDFITPTLVGGAGSTMIGNVVYSNVGIANNVPFAAAFAVVPLIVMGLYLLLARRLGAFEAL